MKRKSWETDYQSENQGKRLKFAEEETRSRLRIYCRIRHRKQSNPGVVSGPFEVIGTDILKTSGSDSYSWTQVFPEDISQEDVFAVVGQPAVQGFMEGKSSVICVCGTGNAGKTYTAVGDRTDPGLVPRMLRAMMESSLAQHLSIVQLAIEQERVYDLMNRGLEVKSKPENSWAKFTSVFLTCEEDIFRIIEQGERAKRMSAASHIKESTVVFMIKTRSSLRTGEIVVVDFASVRRSESRQEGVSPYSVVGKCISTLYTDKTSTPRNGLVFPESKLHKILQPVLMTPAASFSLISALDQAAPSEACIYLRLMSLVTHFPSPSDATRIRSASPARNKSNKIHHLRQELGKQGQVLLKLTAELTQAKCEIQVLEKAKTDVEMNTRKTVVADMGEAMDAMERIYRQNKNLLVDTYEEIITAKNDLWKQKLRSNHRKMTDEETQCVIETKEVSSGLDFELPKYLPKPIKKLVRPRSPISSRTRSASRMKPQT